MTPSGPLPPRRYTLTHSDATGDLFLTIGGERFDVEALSTWQVRAMADEVLGEWVVAEESARLVVHCRAQGGLMFGTTRQRREILCGYMPMVLEIMRYADRALIEQQPELDEAPVEVKFHYRRRAPESEDWGRFGDYRA